jgi:hypothetical protein
MVKVVVTSLLGSREDAHIISLLLSKFTSYHDFHTQLYTCSAEFDFLPFTYVLDTTLTLLLPMSLVVMVIVGMQVVKRVRWRVEATSAVDDVIAPPTLVPGGVAVQLYHVIQTMAYVVMAILIMRLKLFLTPQLSVLCGLLPGVLRASKVPRLGSRRVAMVAGLLLLLLSSLKGWHNLHQQLNIVGEYNNPEAEQLVLWIRGHTHQSAVFAGTMPTMAMVLLTTRRPVVNHPHYESAALRNRTKHVYTIFSRKPATGIHAILYGMGVDYVISEDGWCRRKSNRPGCSFKEMWDEEDPDNQGRPMFCEQLGSHTPPPFQLAFSNSVYRVLRVATSNHTT